MDVSVPFEFKNDVEIAGRRTQRLTCTGSFRMNNFELNLAGIGVCEGLVIDYEELDVSVTIGAFGPWLVLKLQHAREIKFSLQNPGTEYLRYVLHFLCPGSNIQPDRREYACRFGSPFYSLLIESLRSRAHFRPLAFVLHRFLNETGDDELRATALYTALCPQYERVFWWTSLRNKRARAMHAAVFLRLFADRYEDAVRAFGNEAGLATCFAGCAVGSRVPWLQEALRVSPVQLLSSPGALLSLSLESRRRWVQLLRPLSTIPLPATVALSLLQLRDRQHTALARSIASPPGKQVPEPKHHAGSAAPKKRAAPKASRASDMERQRQRLRELSWLVTQVAGTPCSSVSGGPVGLSAAAAASAAGIATAAPVSPPAARFRDSAFGLAAPMRSHVHGPAVFCRLLQTLSSARGDTAAPTGTDIDIGHLSLTSETRELTVSLLERWLHAARDLPATVLPPKVGSPLAEQVDGTFGGWTFAALVSTLHRASEMGGPAWVDLLLTEAVPVQCLHVTDRTRGLTVLDAVVRLPDHRPAVEALWKRGATWTPICGLCPVSAMQLLHADVGPELEGVDLQSEDGLSTGDIRALRDMDVEGDLPEHVGAQLVGGEPDSVYRVTSKYTRTHEALWLPATQWLETLLSGRTRGARVAAAGPSQLLLGHYDSLAVVRRPGDNAFIVDITAAATGGKARIKIPAGGKPPTLVLPQVQRSGAAAAATPVSLAAVECESIWGTFPFSSRGLIDNLSVVPLRPAPPSVSCGDYRPPVTLSSDGKYLYTFRGCIDPPGNLVWALDWLCSQPPKDEPLAESLPDVVIQAQFAASWNLRWTPAFDVLYGASVHMCVANDEYMFWTLPHFAAVLAGRRRREPGGTSSLVDVVWTRPCAHIGGPVLSLHLLSESKTVLACGPRGVGVLAHNGGALRLLGAAPLVFSAPGATPIDAKAAQRSFSLCAVSHLDRSRLFVLTAMPKSTDMTLTIVRLRDVSAELAWSPRMHWTFSWAVRAVVRRLLLVHSLGARGGVLAALPFDVLECIIQLVVADM